MIAHVLIFFGSLGTHHKESTNVGVLSKDGLFLTNVSPSDVGAADFTHAQFHAEPHAWLDERYANGIRRWDAGGEIIALDSQREFALIRNRDIQHGTMRLVNLVTLKDVYTVPDDLQCQPSATYGDFIACSYLEYSARSFSVGVFNLRLKTYIPLFETDPLGGTSSRSGEPSRPASKLNYALTPVALSADHLYAFNGATSVHEGGTDDSTKGTLVALPFDSARSSDVNTWKTVTPTATPTWMAEEEFGYTPLCRVLNGYLGCKYSKDKQLVYQTFDLSSGKAGLHVDNVKYNGRWLWDGLLIAPDDATGSVVYNLAGKQLDTMSNLNWYSDSEDSGLLYTTNAVLDEEDVLNAVVDSSGNAVAYNGVSGVYLYSQKTRIENAQLLGISGDASLIASVIYEGSGESAVTIYSSDLHAIGTEKLRAVQFKHGFIGTPYEGIYLLPVIDK